MDDQDKALDDRIAAYQAQNVEPEPITEPEPEPIVAAEAEPDVEEVADEVPEKTDDEDIQKRIDRLYFESREAKREAKRLAAENEVLKGARTETKDETVTREAQAMAEQLAKRQIFDSQCNRIAQQMDKEFGSRNEILAPFAKAFPEAQGIPIPLLEAVIDAGEGNEHKVLHHLSKNLDIAEQLLHKTARQQGAEIARIVSKLTAPKPVSKAPPPIKPVAGSATTEAPTKAWDKMTKAEQIAAFDAEERKAYGARWRH